MTAGGGSAGAPLPAIDPALRFGITPIPLHASPATSPAQYPPLGSREGISTSGSRTSGPQLGVPNELVSFQAWQVPTEASMVHKLWRRCPGPGILAIEIDRNPPTSETSSWRWSPSMQEGQRRHRDALALGLMSPRSGRVRRC